MTPPRLGHQFVELASRPQVIQQRIGEEVRIRKEPTLDALSQHPQTSLPIAQDRIRLRNLISRLRIARAALVDFRLKPAQHREPASSVVPYPETERFPDLRLQHGM